MSAPTDNLEAGAGDLVARLQQPKSLGDFWSGLVEQEMAEAAAQLAAVTAENARLRERIEQAYKAGFDFAMMTNSADADLAAENARLREALEPFAACADHYSQPGYNMLQPVISVRSYGSSGETRAFLTRGHFSIARAVLSQEAPN